ncbi:hypothetical protein NADE_004823 [Nannochloris sp. 'desiccata']|nr:hypothetical protein NADE_004823 [Chlorella desiccata (nom. nud.)]
MQGLRPLQAHQDENNGFIARNTLPGKSFGGEEGRNGVMGPMKTPKGAGMPSARKALGNITNHGLHATNILPGKTSAAGSVARKPLGNVTNSKASQAQATTQDVASTEDRIEKLAEDGVETSFGKGWEDLESDREDRIDEEISQRLSVMASLGRRGLPTYYPHWASSSSSAATTAAPAFEQEKITDSLPSPVKMPGVGASVSSFGIYESDFSDLSFLPNVGDDQPLP